MSSDNVTSITPLSLVVQEKNEKRRKVLEAVRERRKEQYKRLLNKGSAKQKVR